MSSDKEIKKIKLVLLERGITQIKMAHDLGLHDSFLSKIINGWYRVPIHLKQKIANYLGVSEKELFHQEEKLK